MTASRQQCPPPHLTGGSGGLSWAPPVGSEAQPQPKMNLVHILAVRKAFPTLILLSCTTPYFITFLHVANPSMTNTEITSACSTVGMVVAYARLSNHRILNFITWTIFPQHFLLFLFRLINVHFRIQINLANCHYLQSFTIYFYKNCHDTLLFTNRSTHGPRGPRRLWDADHITTASADKCK